MTTTNKLDVPHIGAARHKFLSIDRVTTAMGKILHANHYCMAKANQVNQLDTLPTDHKWVVGGKNNKVAYPKIRITRHGVIHVCKQSEQTHRECISPDVAHHGAFVHTG